MKTSDPKLALVALPDTEIAEPAGDTRGWEAPPGVGFPAEVRRQIRRANREQRSLYSFIGAVPLEEWVVEEGRTRLTLPTPIGKEAKRQELDRSGTVTGAAIALHMMRYPDKVYTVKSVAASLRLREDHTRRVMDKLAENGLIAAERRKIPGRKPTRCYWIPFKEDENE